MGYKTILADPPWQCDNQTTTAAPEYDKCFRYKTMPTDEIMKMPIKDNTEKNAHLFLWCIDSMLPDALNVASAWGFTIKCTIIWVKISKWGKPILGCGNYFRHQHEICLFAVKGKMVFDDHSMPSVFFEERTKHSRKPDVFYNIIKKVSPPPRLELFARQNVDGFDAWGDDPNIRSVVLEGFRC